MKRGWMPLVAMLAMVVCVFAQVGTRVRVPDVVVRSGSGLYGRLMASNPLNWLSGSEGGTNATARVGDNAPYVQIACLTMDGVGDYVSTSLPYSGGSSYSAYIYLDSDNSGNNAALFAFGNAYARIYHRGDSSTFYVCSLNTGVSVTNYYDSWHLYEVKTSGLNSTNLLIDGVSKWSGVAAGAPDGSDTNLYIAARASSGSPGLFGKIQCGGFWVDDELVYPCEESSGSTLYSISTNWPDATIVSAVAGIDTVRAGRRDSGVCQSALYGVDLWTNGTYIIQVPYYHDTLTAVTNAVSGYALEASRTGGYVHNGGIYSIISPSWDTNTYAELVHHYTVNNGWNRWWVKMDGDYVTEIAEYEPTRDFVTWEALVNEIFYKGESAALRDVDGSFLTDVSNKVIYAAGDTNEPNYTPPEPLSGVQAGEYRLIVTGSQYIDTGVYLTDGMDYEVKIYPFDGTSEGFILPIGSWNSSAPIDVTEGLVMDNAGQYAIGWGDLAGSLGAWQKYKWLRFAKAGNTFTSKENDDTVVATYTKSATANAQSYTCGLFATDRVGTFHPEYFLGAGEYLKIWSDSSRSTLVFDGWAVPSNSYAYGASTPAPANCMWDSVSSTYKTNMGTGSFSIQENMTENTVNGTFDTASDWTLSNATISGGVCNVTTGANFCYQDAGLVAGNWYYVSFDYTETASSKLRINTKAPGQAGYDLITSVSGTGSGTIEGLIQAQGSYIGIEADTAVFTGTIDNISVIGL